MAGAAILAQGVPGETGGAVGASDVEVTGSRLGAEIRPVTVITREALLAIPALDTASALRSIAGVDLRERAPFGAQADIGLYGSSFEGVLILVDGMPVSDPQTGHHALEFLPPLEAIERIEIIEGPASVIYGPGALGGVVQIITRRPPQNPTLEADVAAGEHDLARGAFFGGGAGFAASGSLINTSGYAPDTEVHEGNGLLRFCRGHLDAEVLMQDKRFGAWQAYSDTFPLEWEEVSGAAGQIRWTDGPWQAWAGFRHKRDHFVLDRDHPEWYDALHTTDRWGGQVTYRAAVAGGAVIMGVEGARDTIESNMLGNHGRGTGGLFGEGCWKWGRFELDAGIRAEVLGQRGSVSPQVSLQWTLSPTWRAFATAGRSERLPSFTELYTQSPAWRGSPNLAPEQVWGLDTGFKGTLGRTAWTVSAFFRRGTDLIDMVRPLEGTGVFTARNVQRQDTMGLLVQGSGSLGENLKWDFSGVLLSQSAAWPLGLESRYADDGLRHKEVAGLRYGDEAFHASLLVTALQRNHRAAHAEADVALAWSPKGARNLSLSVEARNILNEPETGFFGAPGPGRWVWCGLSIALPSRPAA